MTDKSIPVKVIDFNMHFRMYLSKWISDHPDEAAQENALDELVPALYERWLGTKKKWLHNMSPREWFKRINDPPMYLTLLIEYARRGMSAPPPLADCLADCARTDHEPMLRLLEAKPDLTVSADALHRVKAQLIDALEEAGIRHPTSLYISLLSQLREECELGERIVDVLRATGPAVSEDVYKGFEQACSRYAKLAFLDVIADYHDDDRAQRLLSDEFQRDDVNIAFLADCLGRVKCASAMPMLQDALSDPALDYFEYTSVLNAIERILGRTYDGPGSDRSFEGDELFELMSMDAFSEEEPS